MLLSIPVLLSIPALLTAHQSPQGQERGLEAAAPEEYRTAAGRADGGGLHVALETRVVGWRPWGEQGPVIRAHTFAETGAPARVPGPLIRVQAGTEVHVTLRNTLADTVLVRGLRDRGQETPAGVSFFPGGVPLAFVGDSVVLAPGATARVRFTPTVPGSFYYYGRTLSRAAADPPFEAQGPDNALVGVLIVDAPDERRYEDERILLISQWADPDAPGSWQPTARFLINGRSWPHTERLVYEQGDTVRWRVINQSGGFHPMHLHGFYFHVEDWMIQTGRRFLPAGVEPTVVTQPMPVTSSFRMWWVADEPGNWLFHCHLMRHMSRDQGPPSAEHAHPPGNPGHPPADHAHAPADQGGIDAMAGLVMGITVRPGPGYRHVAEPSRRRLRLHITRRADVFGDEPAYAFVLQESAEPPAADSVRFPGSPIVLTRGEPAEIVVHNRSDVPLGVHWHGLELESRGDGVSGWSGTPDSPVPATAPGDSLVVRITPRRAGSFMYHVHSEPGHQLAQGLYGPFLVMEPGQAWEPELDRFFVLGALGAGEDPPPAVNGRVEPDTLHFRVGATYRLRFMHISPNEDKSVFLLSDDEPVEWRRVAVDGADLAPEAVRPGRSEIRNLDVGITQDVLWTPQQPGDLTLRIVTRFYPGAAGFRREAPPTHTMDIPFRVRE